MRIAEGFEATDMRWSVAGRRSAAALKARRCGRLGQALARGAAMVAAAAIAWAIAPAAHAQTGTAAGMPESVKALIPAARREGPLILFGYTYNPRQQAVIQEAMAKYYGIPVKINFSGGSHVRKTAELLQAFTQKVPTDLDIFWSSSTQMVILQKAGALMEIDWPKTFGVDPALQRGETGIRSHDTALSLIVYNTNLVKPADVPKSYDDLLDPKWKGRITTPRSPNPWVNLAFAMGDEKITALLTELVQKQDLKLLPTYPDVRTRVSTGEFALGVGADAFTLERQGAPIAHAPVAPLVLSPAAYNIMTDSKSPNLAKLWAYWATSADGQQLIAEQWGASLVTTPNTETHGLAQKIGKVELITHEFAVQQFEELAAKYSKIMNIR